MCLHLQFVSFDIDGIGMDRFCGTELQSVGVGHVGLAGSKRRSNREPTFSLQT